MKKIGKVVGALMVVTFGVLVIVYPKVAASGVINGIDICGKTVIPSLFPFTVCILFLQNSGALNLSFLTPVTNRLLGLNGNAFSIWLTSLVGGYPVGAKLINASVKKGELTPKSASYMLNFCVNAGPAFIISAVGQGAFKSIKIGVILLAAHILASFLLLVASRLIFREINVNYNKKGQISFADNFVLSAADGSQALITICGFVILFSAITEFFKNGQLEMIGYLLEVTRAVTQVKNLYVISFLLGFSGFSIWCQIFAIAREFKVNVWWFVLSRALHGILSALITFGQVKIFKVTIPTFSLGGFEGEVFTATPQIAVSLVVTVIVFIISVSSKNFTGKLQEDIV